MLHLANRSPVLTFQAKLSGLGVCCTFCYLILRLQECLPSCCCTNPADRPALHQKEILFFWKIRIDRFGTAI